MNNDLTPIERIAAWAEKKLGLKPVVTNTFLTGIILLGVNWAIAGEPFDLTTARGLVVAFILAGVGIISPPATGITLNRISRYRTK